MPGGLCACGGLWCACLGCSFGWWGDGFVVMALVLGFRGIWVWGWGAEKAQGFILSLNSVIGFVERNSKQSERGIESS